MLRTALVALGVLAGGASAAAAAPNNILFILDASGSMWGRMGDVPKIEIAKGVLSTLVTDLPAETQVGLATYGHRVKEACDDLELLAPVGGTDPNGIQARLQGITPLGKTPIAASLAESAVWLQDRREENNNVVLISDGLETCGGDPCQAAQKLAAVGVSTRVYVVGFDLSAEEHAQLKCISDLGKGQYFQASTASDLKLALAEIEQVAQAAPEPAPVKQVAAQGAYFEDSFDGETLGEDWSTLNPNEENYLVEDSKLTLVAPDGVKATYATAPNVLRLNKPVPKGDWTMTARFLLTPQTMGEFVRIGVATDDENSLFASFRLRNYNYARTEIFVRADKVSKGKPTDFERKLMTINERDLERRSGQFSSRVKALQLRLEKSGRNYVAAARFESVDPSAEGAVSEEWFTVQQLTSLRSPGDAFTVIFSSNSNDYTPNNGEGLLELDWVQITASGG